MLADDRRRAVARTERFLQQQVLGDDAPLLDGAADREHEVLVVNRLGQVIERAFAHRRDGFVDRAVSGHQQHGEGRVEFLRGAQHAETVARRQAKVGEPRDRAMEAQCLGGRRLVCRFQDAMAGARAARWQARSSGRSGRRRRRTRGVSRGAADIDRGEGNVLRVSRTRTPGSWRRLDPEGESTGSVRAEPLTARRFLRGLRVGAGGGVLLLRPGNLGAQDTALDRRPCGDVRAVGCASSATGRPGPCSSRTSARADASACYAVGSGPPPHPHRLWARGRPSGGAWFASLAARVCRRTGRSLRAPPRCRVVFRLGGRLAVAAAAGAPGGATTADEGKSALVYTLPVALTCSRRADSWRATSASDCAAAGAAIAPRKMPTSTPVIRPPIERLPVWPVANRAAGGRTSNDRPNSPEVEFESLRRLAMRPTRPALRAGPGYRRAGCPTCLSGRAGDGGHQ